jgi:MFS family permease
MVAHATDQGVPPLTAAAVLGVSALASVIGRITSGLVADRLGAKPTLVTLLAVQSPAILLYLVTRDASGFYALAVLFGLGYGGVMPLYALLTREYFGARAMGGAYGAIFMLQAIGMGLGAFAGGWVYDRLGDYAWFFAAAGTLAATAIVVACALRAPRRLAAVAAA